MSESVVVYVCERCLTPAGEGGTCTYCGGSRVACKPPGGGCFARFQS
jgi:hypothetical protein